MDQIIHLSSKVRPSPADDSMGTRAGCVHESGWPPWPPENSFAFRFFRVFLAVLRCHFGSHLHLKEVSHRVLANWTVVCGGCWGVMEGVKCPTTHRSSWWAGSGCGRSGL